MNKRDASPIPSPSGSSTNHRPSDEEIAARAYELFQARGAAPGNDLDDWLQAEQELTQKKRDSGLLHSMGIR